MKTQTTLTIEYEDRYKTVMIMGNQNYCGDEDCLVQLLNKLNKQYSTKEKVEALINRGFIVQIGDTPEETEYLQDYGEEMVSPMIFKSYLEVVKTFHTLKCGFVWSEERGWEVVFN